MMKHFRQTKVEVIQSKNGWLLPKLSPNNSMLCSQNHSKDFSDIFLGNGTLQIAKLKRINILKRIPHWVESVRMRSFSGRYFPALGLNTERIQRLHIHSECWKIRNRETPNTDTFSEVSIKAKTVFYHNLGVKSCCFFSGSLF